VIELDLVSASGRIAAGELSPVELTEAYLAKIAEVDPAVGAYVTVTASRARDDARRAEDELARGEHRGPLHGIPIGLKDLIDTGGIRTTAGSIIHTARVPARDATVAARLREAGTVLLGKHATHEFAWGGTTTNVHFGATRNPFDATRVPGGSSGGSAASVVTGTSLGSIGTDTCGSVRIPAALSGCVGFKPTYGRVSLTGIEPLGPSLDHVGPIARTVRDAALLLSAVAGPDAADPRTALTSAWSPGVLDGDLSGVRVGVLGGFFSAVLDPSVEASVAAAVRCLADAGCAVRELVPPDFGDLVAQVFTVVHAEGSAHHAANFAARPEAFGPELRGLLAQPVDIAAVAAARRRIAAAAGWLVRALEEVDVLVSATVPAPAPPIGVDRVQVGGVDLHIEAMLTRLTSVFDVAGLPALSVPGGTSPDGLPIGLQFVGRAEDEAGVLRIGAAYEVARGPVLPLPVTVAARP
jgi:aspartyl-tRNA(Asn)/glutamyl-tRNA(Gln) amidotransferase subunit A